MRWARGLGRARARTGLVVVLAAFVAVGAAAGIRPSAAGTNGRRGAIPANVIQHVVVIFQENHSFDETFGDYCVINSGRCDGTIGPVQLADGSTVNLTQSADALTGDVPHGIASQVAEIDKGKMDGWSSVPQCWVNGVDQCLTYYAPSQIPSLSALADSYAISDRTFSMENSPSWGGHIYVAAATQDGFTGANPKPVKGVPAGPGWGCDSNKVSTWTDPTTKKKSAQPSCIPAPPGLLDASAFPYNGAFEPTQVPNVPTIFDRLDAQGLPWRIYSSVYEWQVCPNFAECLYSSQHDNVVKPTQVLSDAKNGTLPAYSLVLPSGPHGTGQHPPASMLVGDNWIGQVVSALQNGPEWSSTAVFITYDDCGCFYDHVAPGVNPDGTKQGIRVPMVIVSPYAKPAFTDSQPATFASILTFTEEALGLTPLGVNDANAYDYSGAFDFSAAPTGPRVELKQAALPASTRAYIAAHPELEAPDDDDGT